MNSSFTPTQKAELPVWLRQDMRSNHAGETGAVYIYRGILSVSKDEQVRTFAQEHLATEETHLELISNELPVCHHNAVYATIDAVETFVGEHYLEQIDRLKAEASYPELRTLLGKCRDDEIDHRDEARDAQSVGRNPFLRGWCWLVGAGSKYAVMLARWR